MLSLASRRWLQVDVGSRTVQWIEDSKLVLPSDRGLPRALALTSVDKRSLMMFIAPPPHSIPARESVIKVGWSSPPGGCGCIVRDSTLSLTANHPKMLHCYHSRQFYLSTLKKWRSISTCFEFERILKIYLAFQKQTPHSIWKPFGNPLNTFYVTTKIHSTWALTPALIHHVARRHLGNCRISNWGHVCVGGGEPFLYLVQWELNLRVWQSRAPQ